MINKPFYNWLIELSKIPSFFDTIAITDRALSEQYHVEIALRFLVFRRLEASELANIGEVGEFLTSQMTKLAEDASYDLAEEKRSFEETFSLIASAVSDKAFHRWDPRESRFKGGFSVSAFEAVAMGLGHWIPSHVPTPDIEGKIQGLWSTDDFINFSGSGVRASTRIPKTIALGRSLFRP
jgi:hypothetical protein